MGTTGSLANCHPDLVLGPSGENICSMACNDDAVLVIDGTKRMLRRITYDGGDFVRESSLQPVCCCSTSTGGWVVGFKTGQISEFDFELNTLFSYRLPGSPRAHEAEVTHVRENSDKESRNCHLISIATNGTCSLWDKRGRNIYNFTSQAGLSSIESSPFFVFLGDKKSKFYTVSVDSLTPISFPLPSPARCISSVGDGFGCIAALDDGSVAVISPSEVVARFQFERKIAKVMPLSVEEGTGLIVFLATDEDNKLLLCALDYCLEEIGSGAPVFTTNNSKLVTILQEKIVVFSIDKLNFSALSNLPDVGLPRREIAEFLMRQI